MALKPTIYKVNLTLSDLNHDFYSSANLTLALHPSETKERMMARLLAYCLHMYDDPDQGLTFTRGLSSTDEPDIWLKSLDDQILSWIEVGEPSFDRLKKSCRLAKASYLYSFNAKSAKWWKDSQQQITNLPIEVACFNWEAIQSLALMTERTMDLSVMLSGQSAFVSSANSQVELSWQMLHTPEN
ncbi:YaeQ family protein [Paraglaciecola aestuariivivens]